MRAACVKAAPSCRACPASLPSVPCRLYNMGVITTKKSLVQLEKLSTASFCRRRLAVVMVRARAVNWNVERESPLCLPQALEVAVGRTGAAAAVQGRHTGFPVPARIPAAGAAQDERDPARGLHLY